MLPSFKSKSMSPLSFTKLFHPFFFSLFLLSVFLIEGSLKFFLFTLWALFFVVFDLYQRKLVKKTAHSAKLDSSKLNQADKRTQMAASLSTVLSMLLALAATISVAFSSHLPLSLEKFTFYLLAMASFIFFRSLKEKILQPSLFFYYLSLSSLVLNLFVLLFTFMDPGAELFTGMNLLIRNYGHNHYAAFLLIVIPIFWWQLLLAKDESWASSKEIKIIAVVLLLSSYLLIIFSLGRVAMALSLLQLLIIFFLHKKELFKSVHSEFYQALVKAFVFSFTAIIGLFFILSLPLPSLTSRTKQLCPLLLSRKELCASWLQNDRQRYWQKAWLIFSDKPLVGSGLKTFNFASRQFPMANYATTSYAHNIFLNNLAEGGLVFGGFFICYIGYLFSAAFRRVRGGGQPLDKFLYLAAATSFLNAMLDYDWNFFVIFNLTLIFLALILRQADEPHLKLPIKLSSKLTSFFIFLLLGGTLLSGTFFAADRFREQGKIDLLVKHFPFMDRSIRRAMADKKLSAEHFTQLDFLYRLDPYFISELTTLDDASAEQRAAAWLALAELDPLFFVSQFDTSKLTFAQAKPIADKFVQTAQKYDFLDDTNFLDYWHQRNVAVSFFNFANQAYQAGEVSIAVSYYQQARLLNPYVFGDRRPVFLSETDLNKAALFLAAFQTSNPESDLDFNAYVGLYQRTLLHLFEQDRLIEFYALTEKILEPLPNHAWFLINDLVKISQTSDEKLRLEEVYQHLPQLEAWNDFLPLEK